MMQYFPMEAAQLIASEEQECGVESRSTAKNAVYCRELRS